ncbi:MAG: efflux RND transporter periplasmic adaptor subunit [Planctomycetia bacterium]|nr:efflux RND transporter periplasmic adaptor subunit [Planctomycetia bacterium]
MLKLTRKTILALLVGIGGMCCVAVWLVGDEAKKVRKPVRVESRLEGKEKIVEIQTVESNEVCIPRRFSAILEADRVSTLSFRVGGPLIEVAVSTGDHVKKGDILMRIDPRDFQHEVDVAQAKLRAARAQLTLMKSGARKEDIQILEARIVSAKAQRDYAAAELRRAEPLVAKKAISRSEIELMQSNLRVADAQIDSLEQELIKARAGEREEEIEVKKAEIAGLEVNLHIAQSQLADTYLRAPFDGVVASKCINNHEIVRPGAAVLTMMDISKLDVEIWIPERDILHSAPFSERLSASVTFPNLPNKEFQAVLKDGETEANPQTKAWKVTFSMINPDAITLLPGMSAYLVIQRTKPGSAAILIPTHAVASDDRGKNYVWICDEGHRAQKREVVLGTFRNSEKIEVLEGLEPGEKIVVSGAQFVEEGAFLREAE